MALSIGSATLTASWADIGTVALPGSWAENKSGGRLTLRLKFTKAGSTSGGIPWVRVRYKTHNAAVTEVTSFDPLMNSTATISGGVATFEAVIGAIQAFGRALAGTDGTHDERARLVTRDEGATVEIWFIDVPPVGDPSDPFYYTLAEVKATPGAPSGADFDAVTAKFIAYSDSVSGYA